MTLRRAWPALGAFGELLRYDLAMRCLGFERIRRMLAIDPPARRVKPGAVEEVCAAVDIAAAFYFKRVLCLQRSVTTVRLLRERGVDAKLVVGHRLSPALFHAWVEVDGCVVNDSPAYKQYLKVLWTV